MRKVLEVAGIALSVAGAAAGFVLLVALEVIMFFGLTQ